PRKGDSAQAAIALEEGALQVSKPRPVKTEAPTEAVATGFEPGAARSGAGRCGAGGGAERDGARVGGLGADPRRRRGPAAGGDGARPPRVRGDDDRLVPAQDRPRRTALFLRRRPQ